MSAHLIDQFLSDCRVAIGNAQSNADLQTGFALIGYGAGRLAQGQALLDEAIHLHTRQQAEYGEAAEASSVLGEALAAMRKTYMRHLAIARVAFKRHTGARVALGLSGRRRRSQAGLIMQAQHFYDNALSNEEFKAGMAGYNQTEEVLTAAWALVDAAAAAKADQEEELGEAQEATERRDDALDALEDWMEDFRAIAEVAFADDPQQLEKLGFLARS